MILKERDAAEHRDGDDFSRAGAKAEQQMSHYLRRAFGDDPDVLVLNDVRLEVEDEVKEALQIDHLVIHRHGLILVESKSVTGRIRVNEQGEWVRTWSSGSRGMPSPVLQAIRQADLLKKALHASKDQILGKFLFGKLQKGFRNCPFEVIVAISDQGIIERGKEIPELCKADQVPERVKLILDRHNKAARFIGGNLGWSSKDGVMEFSEEERRLIASFIVEHHYPLADRAAAPRNVPQIRPAKEIPLPTSAACPRCGSPLVARTARKGTHAGDKFLGCTGYPKCRYTLYETPKSN